MVRLDKEYEREGRELRTKAYIIDRELERVHQAETLEQLQDALNEAGERLQQLDVFSRIDMLVTEEPEVREGQYNPGQMQTALYSRRTTLPTQTSGDRAQTRVRMCVYVCCMCYRTTLKAAQSNLT